MKLSIITVSFNSSRTIRDTLESVLSQTFNDYEYIIKDGGSKDGTLDIVREYEPKFEGRMKIVSERDKGIYDAMNQGLKMAQGEVMMLINSDDLLAHPDVFQMVVDKFEQNPDAECVYGDLYYVSRDDISNIVRRWRTGEQKSFISGWHPAHPTFYVKRVAYQKYGYFNLNYQLASDFELMLRFVEVHKIRMRYLSEYLVRMRLGGASSKNLRNIYLQGKECLRAFKENGLKSSPLYLIYRYLPKFKQFIRHE